MKPRLQHDERGGIWLVALVSGAVLMSGAYYMLNVSNAIVTREVAQSSADAIAGEGAYWHAQGMNLLALLNICMSVVLSLFVVVRTVELLALAVAVVFVWVPGVPSAAMNVANWAYKVEQRITNPIMRTLDIGTKSEKILAAAIPYVAVAKSVQTADDLPGGTGFAYSPTLFPTWLDRRLYVKGTKIPVGKNKGKTWEDVVGQDIKTFPARLGGLIDNNERNSRSAQAAVLKLGKKVKIPIDPAGFLGSLPVEEEDYQQLCKRAALNIFDLMAKLGVPELPYARNVVSFLGGNLPGLVCEPFGAGNATSKLKSEYKGKHRKPSGGRHRKEEEDSAKQQCEAEKSKDKGCVAGKLASMADASKKALDDMTTVSKTTPNTDKIKTARLWFLLGANVTPQGELAIGNAFLHVWSQLEGSQKPSSAKAAYYALCVPNEKKVSCAENAMWRLRWRYKLGVDRDVYAEISTLIGDSVRGYVGFLEGQLISRFGIGKYLNGRKNKREAAGATPPRSVWVDRILGANVQAKSGKNNCSSWCDPTTRWMKWDWLYDLANFH